MTAPTQTYPALELTAVPANPIATGTLYSAATLTDLADPARIDGGARIEQINCGDAQGTWPLDCPTPSDVGDKTGDRAGSLSFPAFAVWAVDECSLVGTSEADARARAAQRLRLVEQVEVGREFAATLLDKAGAPATAASIRVALGALEEQLGDLGVRGGVIHASRRLFPLLNPFVERGANGRLETKLGTAWAFGPGYGSLGDTLVATGPVTIYRTPIAPSIGLGARQNDRTALAEREVLPTFECAAWAHTITSGDTP